MNNDGLIEAFLEAVKDLSPREAAQASGVSFGSITKWRAGERAPLLAATQRKLRDYLGNAGKASEPRTKEPPPVRYGERPEIHSRLAAVEKEAAGDAVRLALAYDALAAAINAEARVVEARAAEARARALEAAEDASKYRNQFTAGPLAPLTVGDAQGLVAYAAEILRRVREQEAEARRAQEPQQQRAAGGA